MKKHPIYLNYDEVISYIKSLKTVSDQITCCDFLIKVYRESFNNRNDNDVLKYLKKYKIISKFKSMKREVLIFNNSFHWFDVDIKFKTPGYVLLHEKTSYLLSYLSSYKSRLFIYRRTVEDGFELVLTQDLYYYKIDTFDSDLDLFLYTQKLKSKLYAILFHFDNSFLSKLIQLYNIDSTFKADSNTDDKRIIYRDYLRDVFIPLVEKDLDVLMMKVAVETVSGHLKNGVSDENLIYYLWDFDYNRIKKFSDSVFLEIENKIKYFAFVVKSFIIKYPVNPPSSRLNSEYIKISEELKSLQIHFEMNKSLNSNSSPVSSDFKVVPTASENSGIKNQKRNKSKHSVSNLTSKTNLLGLDLNILDDQKPVWLASRGKLKTLMYALQNKVLIPKVTEHPDRTDDYLASFYITNDNSPNNNNPTLIHWQSSNSDFVYLFSEFYIHKSYTYLEQRHIWKKLSTVFCKQNGSLFNTKTLGALSKRAYKVKNKNILDEIISKVVDYEY